jgi:hypothetical protein
MPPVVMITAVVLPALSASRTSIQVISSIHTVFVAGSGLGVSLQLYGLALQLPPPMLRGSREPPAARLTAADIKVLAETHVAISVVNDSADARAAQSKNKTKEAQVELAHQKRAQLAEVIKAKGLSESEYQRQRFLVSTDADLRAQFDSVVAKLTGAPLPGRVTAAAAPGFFPASELPAGLVGTHVGHVSTSYVDTPDKSGLLPMAFVEAQIATQHANLAMRTPMDLAAMQMHAGHVLHALDPSIVPMGPGKGYGFRKAAGGVAQHIELAAKEPSASGNVKIHATHIAGAARSALARMELAIELAKKIRDAKDARRRPACSASSSRCAASSPPVPTSTPTAASPGATARAASSRRRITCGFCCPARSDSEALRHRMRQQQKARAGVPARAFVCQAVW